jgi:hypothetical protein
MKSCPQDLVFSQFIDGVLSQPETIKILEHIAHCQNCARVWLDMQTHKDLKAESLLPELTSEESYSMSERLKKVIALNKPANKSVNLKGYFQGILGGVVGVGGIVGLEHGIGTPAHSFAQKNENNFDANVRNDSEVHSQQLNPENIPEGFDHNPLERENPMAYNPAIEQAPLIIGRHETDDRSDAVLQHYADTCAVRSQELILHDFGIDISEDQLFSEAKECGVYTPGSGTSVEHVGDLLELHGIEVNRYHNANIFTLTSELAQGHKVIIGVDANELWTPGPQEVFNDHFSQGGNHALVVSGIDTQDPDHVKVILTDPGTGDVAKAYPVEQFMDAWKDTNCFMVSTQEPAPAWLPEMTNFDYDKGHIDKVGELTFEVFIHMLEHFFAGDGSNVASDTSGMGEILEAVLGAHEEHSISEDYYSDDSIDSSEDPDHHLFDDTQDHDSLHGQESEHDDLWDSDDYDSSHDSLKHPDHHIDDGGADLYPDGYHK